MNSNPFAHDRDSAAAPDGTTFAELDDTHDTLQDFTDAAVANTQAATDRWPLPPNPAPASEAAEQDEEEDPA